MSGCSLTHLRGCGFTHPNMFRSVVASIRRRSIPSTENNNNNSKHMHNVIMRLKNDENYNNINNECLL